MTITAQPYLETFGCHLETGDGHDDHGGECDWGYACGTCGRRVDDSPCPEHAPLNVPGMLLVACDATPRHWSWVLAHDGYEGPCWQCECMRAMDEHAGCEHSHHRAWRRWKITRKLAYKALMLGVAKGHWTGWGGGCEGCMTHFRWGRSGYVLGKRAGWWGCLLRRHHRAAWTDACGGSAGVCVKCSPCPGCGTCRPGES